MPHVAFALIDMRHVCCIIQSDPFHILDVFKERKHGYILGLVLHAVDQQRRRSDSSQARNNRPISQRASNTHFARPVPTAALAPVFPHAAWGNLHS